MKAKNITINIPEQYDAAIWKLKELKIVESRSQAVREALKEFLGKETEVNNLINGA